MPSEKWKAINVEINKMYMKMMTDDSLTDEQYVKLQNQLAELYRQRQKAA